MSAPVEARFYALIDKGDPGDCWRWCGATNGKPGYGKFTVDGRQVLAHRLTWEFEHGPIPDGLEVLHRCDVKLCCNPGHLFLGTQRANVHDAVSKGLNPHKLEADDVREMRRLRKEEGIAYTVLAERYGVTPGCARHAVVGRTWGHVG
jgi:hypothetical protein